MKKGEFISTSRRMVKEYVNRYILKDDHITADEITLIGFSNIEGNLKCVMYSSRTPEIVYKITYNKENDEISSELIKKNGFRTLR